MDKNLISALGDDVEPDDRKTRIQLHNNAYSNGFLYCICSKDGRTHVPNNENLRLDIIIHFHGEGHTWAREKPTTLVLAMSLA